MPIEVPILEIKPPPVYQRIAPRANHLQELGMSQRGGTVKANRINRGFVRLSLEFLDGFVDRLDQVPVSST